MILKERKEGTGGKRECHNVWGKGIWVERTGRKWTEMDGKEMDRKKRTEKKSEKKKPEKKKPEKKKWIKQGFKDILGK